MRTKTVYRQEIGTKNKGDLMSRKNLPTNSWGAGSITENLFLDMPDFEYRLFTLLRTIAYPKNKDPRNTVIIKQTTLAVLYNCSRSKITRAIKNLGAAGFIIAKGRSFDTLIEVLITDDMFVKQERKDLFELGHIEIKEGTKLSTFRDQQNRKNESKLKKKKMLEQADQEDLDASKMTHQENGDESKMTHGCPNNDATTPSSCPINDAPIYNKDFIYKESNKDSPEKSGEHNSNKKFLPRYDKSSDNVTGESAAERAAKQGKRVRTNPDTFDDKSEAKLEDPDEPKKKPYAAEVQYLYEQVFKSKLKSQFPAHSRINEGQNKSLMRRWLVDDKWEGADEIEKVINWTFKNWTKFKESYNISSPAPTIAVMRGFGDPILRHINGEPMKADLNKPASFRGSSKLNEEFLGEDSEWT